MQLPDQMKKFLWRFIKPLWPGFLVITLTGFVWSFNEAIFPYLIKLVINAVNDFHGPKTEIYTVLKVPLIAIVVMWVLMEISMRTKGIMELKVYPKFRANIRQAVFQYTQQHSHEFFSNHYAGYIGNKIADLPRACENIVGLILGNFSTIMVTFITALVLMAQVSWTFPTIMLVWFCLHMGIFTITSRKINVLSTQHSEAVNILSGKIVDVLTNVTAVRSFARRPYEKDYFDEYQRIEVSKDRKSLWKLEKARMLMGVSGLGMIFGMVFTLVNGWTEGWVTIGDFTLVTMLSFGLLGMIWWMSFQLRIFFKEVGTVKSALLLIAQEHDIKNAADAKTLVVNSGEIKFDNVNFYYKRNNVLFDHFSVTIRPGEKVGLVGFSGAGKSTFVNLIMRFYDVTSGAIKIDNQDIKTVTQSSLHENIAMIPQDPSLFHRSLMENIRYGCIDASDEQVINAAKLAHCHDFIMSLDENYQSLVGDRGVKLSGGQRQRIAIARAILKNAPILILDEATSSLDSVTEKVIQQSLAELMRDKTTIVVAHRLSTLAEMDRILVFDQGKIVEDGNHETLLKQNGHFAKMWQMQAGGFLPV